MNTETKPMNEAVERCTAADFLDYDISHTTSCKGIRVEVKGYTLKDYLEDTNFDLKDGRAYKELPMSEVNEMLAKDNLPTIPYNTKTSGIEKEVPMKTETRLMSDIVEQRTAAEFLDYKLQDDSTPSGGISHRGETLEEFLQEICEEGEDITEISLRLANQILTDAGIRPIPYHYEKERQQYACMIAIYAAGVCKEYPGAYVDELPSLQKCIDLANAYDFPMTKDSWSGKDRWVIDTETARHDAERFARTVCEEAAKEHPQGQYAQSGASGQEEEEEEER